MSNAMEQQLKIQFPSIIRNKNKQTEFFGVLRSTDNEPVLVTFTVPNYPNASGIQIQIGDYLNAETVEVIRAKAEHLNFLEYVKLLYNKLQNVPKKRKFNVDCFSKFCHEFRQLRFENPFDKFSFVDDHTLVVSHADEFGVSKEIVIKVDFYNDGLMYEVVAHNFPALKDHKIFQKQCTMVVIYKLFRELIKMLMPFHDTINRIDEMCWVVAPLNATYEHNYRTIVIAENNVSLKLTFDPWNMSKLPEFRFFGPSNIIEIHNFNLTENLSNWDWNKDIFQNILTLLDIPFLPIKPDEEPDDKPGGIVLYDANTECCICLSFHLKDEVPDVVCEFESCKRHFHNECLYEWLSRSPNCQIQFGCIRGECPNCEKDGGPFPDRRNVIQYLSYFYYVCDLHLAAFFMDPSKFIPPKNVKLLPENLPCFIKHSKTNRYHEDGLCITCFWDNQPNRVLKKGSNKYVIKYKDVNYRFCSERCAKIFFRQPKKYANLVINFRDKNKPSLCDLSKLPTLGYLEQLAGQLVIDAVINTEIERPYLLKKKYSNGVL